MPLSVTEYRKTIGNHLNWSDKQYGNQKQQNERIQQLAAQPGNHPGNRDRQRAAGAAVQLLAVLTSVQSSNSRPAITSARADELAAKERVVHADNVSPGKRVKPAINGESSRNYRTEHSAKTGKRCSELPGATSHSQRAGYCADQPMPDQLQSTDSPILTAHPASVPEKTITSSVSGNTLNGGNRFSTMLSPVMNTVHKTGQFISHYDLLKFPVAAALPVREEQQSGYITEIKRIPRHVIFEKKTTPALPADDDVKIEKRDYSCIEKRQHLSLADVFRQVGNTLSNPLSELSKEMQVMDYLNRHKGCPSEEDVKILTKITTVIDRIISSVTSLLPDSQPLVVIQGIGGPLFKMIADDIDQKKPDINNLLEANNQLLGLTKSVVAFSPKTADGKTIDSKLALPKGLSFKNKEFLVKVNEKKGRLLYRRGEFFINNEGKDSKISYSPQNEIWFTIPDKDYYIEPLSKNRHDYAFPYRAFSDVQLDIIDKINVDKQVQLDAYYHLPTNNPLYYGTGKIIFITGGKIKGQFIEMGGHYIPVRTTQHKLHGQLLEVYDVKNPDRKGHPIEWDGKRWLFEKETSVHVDKSLENIITQKAFAKDTDASQLSSPDHMGIRIDTNGNKYIKIRNNFVRLFKVNDSEFIVKDGKNHYIVKFRDDVFTVNGVKDDILTEFDEDLLRSCGLLPRVKRSPCVHSFAESQHLDHLRHILDPQEYPVSTQIKNREDAIERLRPFYTDDYISNSAAGPEEDLPELISHYNNRKLYEKMHFSELFSIYDYGKEGYLRINDALLHSAINPEIQKSIDHLELSLRYLSEMQEKDPLIINNSELYRGEVREYAEMNGLREGDIYSSKAFFSTTDNREAVDGFISSDPDSLDQGKVNVIYNIEEALPYSGARLDDVINDGESEYLFLPDIKFKITEITYNKEEKLFEINLEQIPVSYEEFSSQLTALVRKKR